MASLRGATQLWDATLVDTGDASAAGYVPGDSVAVFIANGANSHVFKVQVAALRGDQGGLNEYDAGNPPDGGLIWYDYVGAETLTVGANEEKCWDLSPFAPQLVRLFCVSGTENAVSAIVTSYGPN